MKYRVLKETPWHNVGDIITEEEHKDVYCDVYYLTKGCDVYLTRGEVCPISDHKKELFFQPIRYEKLPPDFIWDGHIYTKCMDGMYKKYKDVHDYQVMTKYEVFGLLQPDKLLASINKSTLPVFEINKGEQPCQ